MAEQTQTGNVSKSLSQTATSLSRVVKTLQSTAKSVGQVALAVSTVGKAASSASSSTKKLTGQIRDLFSFDEINRLSSVTSSSSSSSGGKSSGSSSGKSSSGKSSGNITAIKEEATWLEKLKKLLNQLLTSMGNFLNLNGGNTLKALQNLKNAASALGTVLKGALNWGYQNVLVPLGKWTLQSLAPTLLNALAGVIRILTAELKIFQPIGQAVWENILEPLASWSGKLLVNYLGNVANAISWVADRLEGLAELVNSGDILGSLQDFGANLWSNLVSGLKNGASWIAEAFGSLFSGTIFDWIGLSSEDSIQLPVQLAYSAAQLWQEFKSSWSAQNACVTIGNALSNAASTLWSNFKAAWGEGRIAKIVNQLQSSAGTLWSNFKAAWGESRIAKIANQLQSSAGTLWSNFKAAWGESRIVKIANQLQSSAGTLWSKFKTAWGTRTLSIKNKLATSAATLWNNLKSGWSNKSLSLKVTYSTNVSALKKAVYKALGLAGWPTLQFAARGGIVRSATLLGNTLVGEAGMEAIVPLENHTEWMDKVAQRLASQLNGSRESTSGQPILVQVVLDGRVVGQTAVDYINGQARANGVHPLGAYL